MPITDYDELVAVCRSLLETWAASSARGQIEVVRATAQSQFAVVHSFSAHAHYIAGTAVDLIDKGRVLVALPLVRSVYEFALTAQ